MKNLPDSAVSAFDLKTNIRGVDVEVAWDRASGMLCFRDVADAEAADRILGWLAGAVAPILGGPWNRQLVPSVAVEHNGHAIAPATVVATVPAVGPSTTATPPPQYASVPAPATPPPPDPAPTPTPTPAKEAHPSEAVFARATRMGEVIEELIRLGHQGEDALIGAAMAVRAQGLAPVLLNFPEAGLADRLRPVARAEMAKAGL